MPEGRRYMRRLTLAPQRSCLSNLANRLAPWELRFWALWSISGWQKLREGTRGLPRKVWTRTNILSPNIRYFVAIYALFRDLRAKKVPFWVKNSVSWARSALLHGIYCIFYWVKFAKWTQWDMQYIPCNSALFAQETLFLTQKGTFFAQRSPKSA